MEKVSIKEIEQLTELFHTAYSNNEKLGIHFKAATISQMCIRDREKELEKKTLAGILKDAKANWKETGA